MKRSFVARTLWVIALLVVIGVGLYLGSAVRDLRSERVQDTRKVIHAGAVRLEKTTTEQVRTQTLVCLAHPERRRDDPTFDQLCTDVIARWRIKNSTSTSAESGGG